MSTGPSAKESWEGLGYGNRRRRFLAGLPRFLHTRGCVRRKNLFSVTPRSVLLTLSVLRTKLFLIFYGYEVTVAVAI